ncbi:MAG TPA: mechanosensitive ion channel domain-containing protein, partial [Elusimicrobiota bacterium]|nr:mechanosensitive ion channel domain-containing protein [Elusimicrobiota bacterium]
LQNLTANFISGLILLVEEPVRVGDRITVGGYIGTVKSIGMRATEVQTLDELALILPNSTLVQDLVINWTHGDRSIRLHIPFGVAYGTDIERLRAVALEACRSVEGTMADPAPELRFLEFGGSSLNFEILIWIVDPWIQFRVKSDTYFALERAFRQGNIEVPFPQRVVHLRGETAA